MKKSKKIITSILCGILALASLGFGGCNGENACKHTFINYVAKDPTCTEKGILESLCDKCGEKQFSEIQAKGHKLVNGVCTLCGHIATKDDENVALGENVGWTFQDVYERFSKTISCTKEEFINNYLVTGAELSDLYVTENGNIRTTVVCGEYRFETVLFDVREDFEYNPTNNKNTSPILELAIRLQSCGLEIQYTDNTILYPGYVNDFLIEGHQELAITRVIVNLQNEVLLVYNNGSVSCVGTIPTEAAPSREDTLIYLQTDSNSYEIYGATNNSVSALSIPYSHRGYPLTTIYYNAFNHFKNLKTVIIPSNITCIRAYAFPEGTKIFTDATSVPSGWSQQVVSSCSIYLAGTWKTVNGEPKPIE